jgi:hypothetical protein
MLILEEEKICPESALSSLKDFIDSFEKYTVASPMYKSEIFRSVITIFQHTVFILIFVHIFEIYSRMLGASDLSMTKPQHSCMGLNQVLYSSTQWNLRGGIRSSVKKSTSKIQENPY